MKKISSVLWGVGLGLWTHVGMAQHGVTESIDQYLQKGRGVLNELALGQPNAAYIESEITAMLELTKPVLVAYAGIKPDCRQQLEKVAALLPEIDSWTPMEIRRQIEAAQGLPQAQGCYAARDIVAHPAIVRALVRQGIDPARQGRLAHEMDEAIEHMEEIHTLLQ